MRFNKFEDSSLEYYLHGAKPTIFIDSGLHGDEYTVIDIVMKKLDQYISRLPSFLYIPMASPSAVEKKLEKIIKGTISIEVFTRQQVQLKPRYI